MNVRRRLDVEVTRRGMAESREAARRLIEAGRVTVNGQTAVKPAYMVLDSAAVVVTKQPGDDYASRGAHKLVGALDTFVPLGLRPPAGRMCLDAGASTGGFTDVLLRRGGAGVIAVDVGYGQLQWRLQSDPRVTVLDRCNIRSITPADLPFTPDLVVADLSFISLTVVLPALASVVAADGDMVLMVKPQFEVGRQALGRGGVVRDPVERTRAVDTVAAVAAKLGWPEIARAASPLPGPAGNVEFFVWLQATTS